MNTNEPDNQLQPLFREAQADDAKHVPDFRRLTAERPAREATGLPWLRLAGAVAAIVVLAVSLWLRPRAKPVDISQWSKLSNWQAPTDSLLAVSETPWSASLKTTSDTWFNNPTNNISTNQKETL